ncbi:hypothetical protein D3C84_813470 [compost metagenome]
MKTAAEQAQCFSGEAVREWIFQVTAGASLNRMDHGINTGGSSDMRWQSQRQLGIQHCQIRQKGWRDNHVLFTGTRGDHRDGRDLGTGAGGGWHQY